ncbi:MAG TPA: hypothetical protein VFZ65_04070, partial [Planctomycetota bacterium]|nr:hypothetical protein [Planctomycetota bacterium]
VVVSLSQIPATPLAGIGMPGCNAYVSPDLLSTVTGTAGSATWTVAMPATIGLMGTAIYSQGLSLDPVNPAWLVASNAHKGTLGN